MSPLRNVIESRGCDVSERIKIQTKDNLVSTLGCKLRLFNRTTIQIQKLLPKFTPDDPRPQKPVPPDQLPYHPYPLRVQ